MTGQETTSEDKDTPKVEVADAQFIKEEFRRLEEKISPNEEVVKSQIAEDSYAKEKIVEIQQVVTSSKSNDIELNFGRNWLNKIGIVIFTLGMGFLISYTFKYFGPFFTV